MTNKRQDHAPSGVLVIDKPGGMTSHDVVARARRALGTRKIGHAGTLDPMATGVLVLGVGRGTKLLGYIAGDSKTYQATIRLGQATKTEDAEGELVQSPGYQLDTRLVIAQAISTFVGPIQQVPSAVSAIKVDGKRSYALVREGKEVQLKARPVKIHTFELVGEPRPLRLEDGTQVVDLDVKVDCSSGTYIRALARDLGLALGTVAHLTKLRRSRVGAWTLDDSEALETLMAPESNPQDLLLSLDQGARRIFPTLVVQDDAGVRFGYGATVPREAVVSSSGEQSIEPGGLVAVYTESQPNVALGLASLETEGFRPRLQLVLPTSGVS